MDRLERYLDRLEEDEPRMLEFLRRLIQTPSLSGDEGRVAELIAGEMEGLGYEVEVDEMGSVLGRLGGDGGRTILFDGHMDHVDKGALAAMIYGCAAPQIRGEVVVACVVHEETNEGVATGKLIEDRGLRPDVCVLGEPTDLALSVGQRGRCVFRITTRGVTSHASMPELGRNALYEMTPIIDRIKEANRSLPSHPFLGAGSMAVTAIACSPGAGPIIPDLCEILVDRRLVPQETLNGVLKELRALAAGAEVKLVEDELSCYTGYHAKAEQYFPGWITDQEHRAVEESLRALEEALGKRPGVIGWRFSTDGVATAGALGIPTIGFGPGDPALAHQPDEHLALSDVAAAARGYCSLAYRLTGC
jgi:putative selenium metabolism hydrolase